MFSNFLQLVDLVLEELYGRAPGFELLLQALKFCLILCYSVLDFINELLGRSQFAVHFVLLVPLALVLRFVAHLLRDKL